MTSDSPANPLIANNLMVLYPFMEPDGKLERSLQYVEQMIMDDPTKYCNDTMVGNFFKIYNQVTRVKEGKKTKMNVSS